MAKIYSQIEGETEVFYIELEHISKVVRVSDKLEAVSEVPKEATETLFSAASGVVYNASASSSGIGDGSIIYQLVSDLALSGQ